MCAATDESTELTNSISARFMWVQYGDLARPFRFLSRMPRAPRLLHPGSPPLYAVPWVAMPRAKG